MYLVEYQSNANFGKFANGKSTFFENRDLRKTPFQKPHYMASKTTHFSQM